MPDEVSKPVTPEESSKPKAGLTRREAIKVAAGIAGGIAMGTTPLVESVAAQGRSGGAPGSGITVQSNSNSNGSNNNGTLGLIGGNFVDGRGFVGNALTIKNGRIAAVGQLQALGPDAQVINLQGRTVIPGLINTHVHHSRTGRNAGHEARDVETAFSIQELLQVIAQRTATTPPGQFITCHLGWHYVQLAENRPPTRAELDSAAPNHPVYLGGRAGFVETFFSVANTLGLNFFQGQGLSVDMATGRVNETPETCLAALNSIETDEDKLRETFDNNAWSNSLGVTTIMDPSGSPVTAQDFPALELWRQGMLNVRHRLHYSAGTVETVQTRMSNVFRLQGDDLLKSAGFGETIGTRGNIPGTFEPVARAIAEGGWKLQNHTDFFLEVDQQIAAFQSIANDVPIDNLRWQLIHAFQTTPGQLQTLKELGVGLDLENERYLDRLERGGGPFFQTILQSGINVGFGTDGSNFAPNNPWLMIYYATTGVSVRGIPNNAAQTISRLDALRFFTMGSAFQSFDDDKGTFEVGKVADLAVLNQDFLTVSDAQLRKTRSVLTIVGGKIVHQGDVPQYSPIGTDFHFTGT